MRNNPYGPQCCRYDNSCYMIDSKRYSRTARDVFGARDLLKLGAKGNRQRVELRCFGLPVTLQRQRLFQYLEVAICVTNNSELIYNITHGENQGVYTKPAHRARA